MVRTTLAVAGMLALGAGPAAALAVNFDGDGSPASVGYTPNVSAPSGFAFDAPPGYLQQSPFGGTAYWSHAGPLTRAGGWWFESRFDVTLNTGNGHGAFISAGDDLGGVGFWLRPGQLDLFTSSTLSGSPSASTALAAGYRTLRVEVAGGQLGPASSHAARVYVDGVITWTVTGMTGTPGWAAAFGDGSNGGAGAVSWDHLRFGDGAPPSVPEPGLVGLAGLALIGLARARREGRTV